MPSISIDEKFTLPCGLELPHRLVKSAATEGIADEENRATDGHIALYRLWATNHNAGGTLITGNIQVDRRYLERAGNIAIDGPQTEDQLRRLRSLVEAGKASGTVLIAQLGHAGRQCTALVNLKPIAPSAVQLRATGIPSGKPKAMNQSEIHDVAKRFANAARVCQEVGFDGIQIHAAHGYLLSTFLNPNANIREDDYGGSLENRSRVIHEVVDAIHAAVKRGETFAIGIKLNSADFSKNGFTLEECKKVATSLDGKVDFLEVSGGNYESAGMILGPTGFEDMTKLSAIGTSTQIREAYFVEFAKQIKATMKKSAVMVTGGMRSRASMNGALENGDADLIGVCRPVCGDPYCVGKLLRNEIDTLPSFENTLKLPKWARWTTRIIIGNIITVGAGMLWFYDSVIRVAKGQDPDTNPNLFGVMSQMEAYERAKAKELKIEGIKGIVTNNVPKRRPGMVIATTAVVVAVIARYVLSTGDQ